jgi:hypothetical protein
MSGLPYAVQFVKRLATSPIAAAVYFLILLFAVPALNRLIPPARRRSDASTAPMPVENQRMS